MINLIAQVDLRKAESLIEQIKSLCFIGLFGLRISDKHLEFRHLMIYPIFHYTTIRELIVLDTESNRIFIENTFIPRLVTYNSGVGKITYIKE